MDENLKYIVKSQTVGKFWKRGLYIVGCSRTSTLDNSRGGHLYSILFSTPEHRLCLV